MSPIRVVIVDDQPIVCAGLAQLVSRQNDMKVAGEVLDGHQAIENTGRFAPDVMIMNMSMPGMNGIESTKEIKNSHPEIQILAISFHESQGYVKSVIDAGATGYLLKRASLDEILNAIRSVAEGRLYLDPSLVDNVVNGFLKKPKNGHFNPTKELSDREAQVLKLLAAGYGMKEVAYNMKVSIKTVDTYKRRSFEKLGLHTRVELLKYALAQGWLIENEVSC
jgi:two-component system, NarL family, response regulator NreC